MRKWICLVLVLCLLAPVQARAAGFWDVPAEDPSYLPIMDLSQKGIINGYGDGSFRPYGLITRAEASALVIRAGQVPENTSGSGYWDVPWDHWGFSYIMSATNAGILNGIGDGSFNPEGNVTYYQILKMIVCMLGGEWDASRYGGWPLGYVETALQMGIIDWSGYRTLVYGSAGDTAATRRDVAWYLYNALHRSQSSGFAAGGQELYLGMSAESLPVPEEYLASANGYTWFVYGTGSYRNFYAVGVADGKVVSLTSAGTGFQYAGYRCGDVGESAPAGLYTDQNDGGIVHGVLLIDEDYKRRVWDTEAPTAEQLYGECRMVLHLTNAFRVYHGQSILAWSDQAAVSARLHSEDMASRDYFSHYNPEGWKCGERMDQQGINWWICGENIAAGTVMSLGFQSFNGWVNSAGHRNNLLYPEYAYLGVGMAYDVSSQYRFYHTQNFFC